MSTHLGGHQYGNVTSGWSDNRVVHLPETLEIHSFTQQAFSACLVCAGPSARPWEDSKNHSNST